MAKKILIALMLLAPLATMAQSNWELPESSVQQEQPKKTKEKKVKAEKNSTSKKVKEPKAEDLPYLKGAVPEKDGKVVFTTDIKTNGKSAKEAYDIVYTQLEANTKSENNAGNSKIAIINKEENSIVANFCEWLVFSDKLLELDRAKFNYLVIVKCSNGNVNISIQRLTYEYEDEHLTAEKVITDKYMLSKDSNSLKKANRKFRKKTVDRMREIAAQIEAALK